MNLTILYTITFLFLFALWLSRHFDDNKYTLIFIRYPIQMLAMIYCCLALRGWGVL